MYFVMEGDVRIQNRIQFEDIASKRAYEFEPEEMARIQDITVLFMKGNKDSVYPDVIETPVYMVSDRLKKLLEPYDPSVAYRRAVLNHIEVKTQKMYWLLLAEKIDCLDESSQYYPNGWIKQIILNRRKIGTRRVFKAEGIPTPKLLVHVDVAESIMRRNFEGVLFHPVELRQEES